MKRSESLRRASFTTGVLKGETVLVGITNYGGYRDYSLGVVRGYDNVDQMVRMEDAEQDFSINDLIHHFEVKKLVAEFDEEKACRFFAVSFKNPLERDLARWIIRADGGAIAIIVVMLITGRSVLHQLGIKEISVEEYTERRYYAEHPEERR